MLRALVLSLSISSCVPSPLSTPRCDSTSEEIQTSGELPEIVSDLLFGYTQLFRARRGADDDIDIEILKDMELMTTVALDRHLDDDAPYVELILRLHHKLRSYLSFLVIARQHEERLIYQDQDDQSQRHLLWIKKIKHDLVGMMAKQLRGATSNNLDLSITNDGFYRQVTADDFNLPKITGNDQQNFFNNLVTELIAASEQSIIHYNTLFAFETTDPSTFCSFRKREKCRQFITDKNEFAYTDVVKFTELVNNHIKQSNKLNSEFYFIQTDGSTDEEFADFKERHQQFLAKTTALWPLFFTDTFHNKSGNSFFIDLSSSEMPKPLTKVTPYTVKQMVVDLKKNLITRWLELKDLKKVPKEQEIYQWLVVNEAVTAKMMLQRPQHSLVVISLLNEYQDKPNNPQWLRNIKTFAEGTDLVQFPGMIGTQFGRWLLGKTGAIAKVVPVLGQLSFFFIIAGVVVNFPHIVSSFFDYQFTRRRYAIVQQAVQSGSSMCVISATRLQQQVDDKQLGVIIGGTIGLSLTFIVLGPTVRLGEDAVFFWTGILEIISNLAADPEVLEDFLKSLITGIDDRYQQSIADDDQSYRQIILGNLPSTLARDASEL